ncbi:MAG: phosphoenolpyruvate carboxykinase (GTP) [Thaumarchaeota archaeon]|nr:phosphoenolpyruvate carboxykinase (GTP) [Nitrososphaerota archaeon]
MVNRHLVKFVEDTAKLTQPDTIYWCNGLEAEYRSLIEQMLDDGTLTELNQAKFPNCYLHRSDPNDVARTEHLTFVCTSSKDNAGCTNNWADPDETKNKMNSLFNSCMEGRTMYVVPYIMGPESSPHSQVGVQITDSPYVVVNLQIMTRMGRIALNRLGNSDRFIRGVHSIGELDPGRRFICHFPEENLIMSYGSGYGGNALLSKKCHSLRLASVMARDEGWLAEHMLILGLESPDSDVTYMSGAFPSASGKTNLAMLKPPKSQNGWTVWTMGDDIAWIYPGQDGRFWTINPEAGFFAVAPGTTWKTNPNALETMMKNTVFTNVAVTGDGSPWWDGLTDEIPPGVIDWQGNPWSPGTAKAAHPNARFTTSIRQIPSLSPHLDDPKGVPLSAILFGGRRASLTPLVFEAFDWVHGVFIGATMAAETTAAAVGTVGVVRRDPMAMRPFCGYNIADYFKHWVKMGSKVSKPPRIFHVNWFRTNSKGEYLWPGFGENVRVLKWISERVNGKGDAVKTPIGYVPKQDALDLKGLKISPEALEDLLRVDSKGWLKELEDIRVFLNSLGERVPEEMWREFSKLESRLNS